MRYKAVRTMVRLNVELEEDLFERLKAAINKRYGGIRKGNLKTAIIEAIELWLKQKVIEKAGKDG
jgi:hypothetical protein